MRIARSLGAFGLLALLLVVPTAAAQTESDLVQGFADAVNSHVGEEAALGWDPLPRPVGVIDATNDLFTLEGGTATGPAFVDLLQTSQFAFTMTEEAFAALFGEGGALSCDRPEVSCPPYDIQTEPFATGAFVVGMQLAAAPEVSDTSTFTVAALANDDDWPTFQDPRPNSPFVGTNKAWRYDLTAAGDSVRFLQVVTGPYEEFQTDARVLLAGDLVWFVIPPQEFPLEATITGFRGHSNYMNAEVAADVDGEAAAPALTTPVGQTGGLATQAPEETTTTTTSAPTTTTTVPAEETTTTTVPAEETTTTGAAESTTTIAAETGGISPIVFIVVGTVLLLVALLLFLLMRPKSKCQEEYEAWQAAKAACDSARAAAERAKAEVDRIRAELDQLRAAYPPLGYGQSDEPFTETDRGETISALDMALVAWDNKTRQPPVSEGTGASRDEIADEAAAQRERLREEYRRMKARETELMVELSKAEAAARDAAAKAEKACADADAAELAYRRCMGEVVAPPTAPPGGEGGAEPPPPPPPPEEPKPEEPRPEEPEPEEPKPGEPPPPTPPPPVPPPPVPSGGGGGTEELPRECEEGAERETDVVVETFEMLRDRGRAKVTISNDISPDVEEWDDVAMQAILDASQWAAARARIRGQGGVLYEIDIAMQMERVTVKCYTPEVCQKGRWVRMSFKRREESEPEYFEKTIHREEVEVATLRHILQTARGEALKGGREEYDRFCR